MYNIYPQYLTVWLCFLFYIYICIVFCVPFYVYIMNLSSLHGRFIIDLYMFIIYIYIYIIIFYMCVYDKCMHTFYNSLASICIYTYLIHTWLQWYKHIGMQPYIHTHIHTTHMHHAQTALIYAYATYRLDAHIKCMHTSKHYYHPFPTNPHPCS